MRPSHTKKHKKILQSLLQNKVRTLNRIPKGLHISMARERSSTVALGKAKQRDISLCAVG